MALQRLASRRAFLTGAAAIGRAWADGLVKLDLPGGPDERTLICAFPQKASMIL